jgi:hypothetical protein
MDEDEAAPPVAEYSGSEYARRVILARCGDVLTEADLDLPEQIARRMLEAIDELAARVAQMARRLEGARKAA